MTGRRATTNIIPGDVALSVGMPDKEPPFGWRWVSLSDVATMATGHTPSRKRSEYWGGDIRWMSVRDARPYHGKVIFETAERTNQFGIDNSAAVLLPPGTVCLSRTGSIGYSVILGREMATSQGFVNWICSEELLPRFLQLIFLAENSFLHRISEGVAHTTIYFPEAKAFHVCIPPVNVQERIVSEIDKQFSRLGEAIANLKRVKANLKHYKAAVLKAAVEGVERAWPESQLADVCQIVSGFAFNSVDFCESGIPAIKIANVGYGEFLWKDQEYLPLSFHSKYQSFVVRPGDLLLALTRPITNGTVKVCRYPNDAPVALLNQRVAVLRPTEKAKPEFMLGLLQSEIFKAQLNDALSETLQPNLSPVDLKKFSVRLPGVHEQMHIIDEIDRSLSVIRETESQVDANLQRAERLRQSVLQRCFGGDRNGFEHDDNHHHAQIHQHNNPRLQPWGAQDGS